MRKAFNFYRSFLEVASELPAKYRGEFLFAICDLQLNANYPDFSKSPAILKMAWVSIKHSLEKQLTGYNTATNDTTPSEGTTEGTIKGTTEGTEHQEQCIRTSIRTMNKNKEKEEVKLPANRRINLFSDCFTDWFILENETPFKMQTKDFVAIASIEKYCIENKKEGFEPIALFRFVLEKYNTLPEWYLNNKNPTFINSKFPEIIALLRQKTIKADNQKGKQEKNNDVFANILNEINNSENGTKNGHQRSISQ